MRTLIDMEDWELSSIKAISPEGHYVRVSFGGVEDDCSCVMYLKTEDAYELCQCLKEVVDAE